MSVRSNKHKKCIAGPSLSFNRRLRGMYEEPGYFKGVTFKNPVTVNAFLVRMGSKKVKKTFWFDCRIAEFEQTKKFFLDCTIAEFEQQKFVFVSLSTSYHSTMIIGVYITKTYLFFEFKKLLFRGSLGRTPFLHRNGIGRSSFNNRIGVSKKWFLIVFSFLCCPQNTNRDGCWRRLHGRLYCRPRS